MSQVRTFNLEDVQVVVTLRNTSNSWDGVRALLEHITGQPIWSHQIPLAMSVCHEALRKQIPDLSTFKAGAKIEVKPVPGIDLSSSIIAY